MKNLLIGAAVVLVLVIGGATAFWFLKGAEMYDGWQQFAGTKGSVDPTPKDPAPEAKPEVKPEVKPEAKPEVKPAVKPSDPPPADLVKEKSDKDKVETKPIAKTTYPKADPKSDDPIPVAKKPASPGADWHWEGGEWVFKAPAAKVDPLVEVLGELKGFRKDATKRFGDLDAGQQRIEGELKDVKQGLNQLTITVTEHGKRLDTIDTRLTNVETRQAEIERIQSDIVKASKEPARKKEFRFVSKNDDVKVQPTIVEKHHHHHHVHQILVNNQPPPIHVTHVVTQNVVYSRPYFGAPGFVVVARPVHLYEW